MIFGADAPALRLLAGKLEQISGRLATIESSVSARNETIPWVGADADRFKGTWADASAPSMRDASRVLKEAAQEIRGDAQRQEQISSI